MAPLTDVAVVFTTFHPSESLLKTVRTLIPDHPVVIVDDGSRGPDDVFDAAAALGAHVIRLPENRGIAAALNVGLRRAYDDGARYAVTFDQDSAPEPQTIGVLRRTFDELGESDRAAVVVPMQFAGVRQAVSDLPLSDARRVIQSGMMIPAATFEQVGGFDEGLFIDLVDTEFELRMLTAGHRLVAAPTRIDHELGRTLRLKPFDHLPVTITTMASTPFRYYYRARNRVIITRRYFRGAPVRVLRDLLTDLAYFAVIAVSARPRRSMRIMLREGIRDGIRNRGGRISDATSARAEQITWSTAPDRPRSDDLRP